MRASENNETSKAYTRGRACGYDAGMDGGVSVAMLYLQAERDVTENQSRRKIINDMIEVIALRDVDRVSRHLCF
jgi:hypothetical protein